MKKYVDVILPLPLPKYFTYSLPDECAEEVEIGCRVIVPFGRKKFYTAIAVSYTHLKVVHVDQEDDYYVTFLADNFEKFIRGLVNEDVFDTSEEDERMELEKVRNAAFSPLLSDLCAKCDHLSLIHILHCLYATRKE